MLLTGFPGARHAIPGGRTQTKANSDATQERFHAKRVWDNMLGVFLAVDLLLTFWRWILPFWRWDRNIHCQKVGDVSRKPFGRWMTLLAVHVTLLAVDVVTFWRWVCALAVDVLFSGGS